MPFMLSRAHALEKIFQTQSSQTTCQRFHFKLCLQIKRLAEWSGSRFFHLPELEVVVLTPGLTGVLSDFSLGPKEIVQSKKLEPSINKKKKSHAYKFGRFIFYYFFKTWYINGGNRSHFYVFFLFFFFFLVVFMYIDPLLLFLLPYKSSSTFCSFSWMDFCHTQRRLVYSTNC